MNLGFASPETFSEDSQLTQMGSSTIPIVEQSPPASNSTPTRGVTRDRQQTIQRYQTTLEGLERAITEARGSWRNFNASKFSCKNALEADSVAQLQNAIGETLDAQTLEGKNPQGWNKVKQVMKSVFIATSPFAKVLLIVAKQHSLVLIALVILTLD